MWSEEQCNVIIKLLCEFKQKCMKSHSFLPFDVWLALILLCPLHLVDGNMHPLTFSFGNVLKMCVTCGWTLSQINSPVCGFSKKQNRTADRCLFPLFKLTVSVVALAGCYFILDNNPSLNLTRFCFWTWYGQHLWLLPWQQMSSIP